MLLGKNPFSKPTKNKTYYPEQNLPYFASMKNLLDFVPLSGFAFIFSFIETHGKLNEILVTIGLGLGIIISGLRLYAIISESLKDGKITGEEAQKIIDALADSKNEIQESRKQITQLQKEREN